MAHSTCVLYTLGILCKFTSVAQAYVLKASAEACQLLNVLLILKILPEDYDDQNTIINSDRDKL